MKGNNVFVKENSLNQKTGIPIQLFRAVGNPKLAYFTAGPGSAGEIICNKKQVKDMKAGRMVMQTGSADPSSTYRISDLEPGYGYYIYAVVTDREYESTTEVSDSIGVGASAGI